MNYSNLIKELDKATSFDLYRLRSAIDRMLDDPNRVLTIKQSLRLGSEVEYFDDTGNRAVNAKVVKFLPTKIEVENLDDKKRWRLPYYMINIHTVDTDIIEEGTQQGLGRHEVSVGDLVGFMDRNNHEQYGKVIRLNQKTVTLACEGGQWRVAYCFLFKVLNPQVDQLTVDKEQPLEEVENDNQPPINTTPISTLPNTVSFEKQDGKVGRNHPCPCGSGKKYKKCCLEGVY